MFNTKTSKYVDKKVEIDDDNMISITEDEYLFKIIPKSSKRLGVMIVGLGGNNGTTFVTGILAHQLKKTWQTKNGIHEPIFYGSISQCGSVHVGYQNDIPISKPYKEMIDLHDIDNVVIGGWDICQDDLYTATVKNEVIDYNLREQLKKELEAYKPLPSVFYETFIASNQKSRANNVLKNDSKWYDVLHIVDDINNFKRINDVDDVIILWSATTERFTKGNYRNQYDLLQAVTDSDPEISPSIIFAIASIYTGSIFLNGSPQNTLIKSVIDLAHEYKTFVGGEDFKTGQTKLKSVLADFLVSSGIKPLSIVSYNHLGNNDGKNLDEYPQFRSKEITKKSVIDDIIDNNQLLFSDGEKPDHIVVIKYVKAVGDSKRAMDEYYSQLFLDGRQTIAIHNTCEDSLLAAPLMLDLVLFSNFLSRITFSKNNSEFNHFPTVLSFLSFFFKAPSTNQNEPIINSFFSQKYGLDNFVRILNNLPPLDHMQLHHKLSII